MPYTVPVESIVDDERGKTSQPGLLFVTQNVRLESTVVDDEVVPKRKTMLAKSLRPLLSSMRLFGLYFSRPSEKASDDANEKSRKWGAYMMYATGVVVLLWLNVARVMSIFTNDDKFGFVLLNKLVISVWAIQCAISQTAFYAASRRGVLAAVFRQHVHESCAAHAQKIAAVYAALSWLVIVVGSGFFTYTIFFSGGLMDGMLAPIQSHVMITDLLVPRIIVNVFAVYLLAAYIFPHALAFLLAMIFSFQFKQVERELEKCLDNRERRLTESDVELLRQKHQEISMTISNVDDSLMFSNASAFCSQLFCFIILLYVLIFYISVINDPVVIVINIFWMLLLSFGLVLTAAGGIMVNHYVS